MCDNQKTEMTPRLRENQNDSSSISASGIAKRPLLTAITIGVILFLWQLQSTKLDSFYDSVIVSSVPLLNRGMTPFRDFITPLPSLPYYLVQISEKIFGPGYRSLSYANLLLTGAVFTLVLCFARKVLRYQESLLLAFAVSCALTVQHNIIWYNDLGMVWVISISFVCASAIARGSLRYGDAICLSVLLCLCVLTKINFFLAGAAIVCSAALYLAIVFPHERLKAISFALGAVCFGVCFAPLWEVWSNGTNLRTYLYDIIVLPGSRGSTAIRTLYTRDLWVNTVNSWYSGNPFRGIIGVSVLLFSLTSARCRLETEENAPGRFAAVSRWVIPLTCLLFLSLTIFLVTTNWDICSVGESLLIVGLLCTNLAFRKWLSGSSSQFLRFTSLGLAAWLAVCGVVAISRHSRLIYPPSAEKREFSFKIDDPKSYLCGIWLSERSHRVLVDAAEILQRLGIPNGSDQVYWGPSTELLGRVFDSVPVRGFPLWYHRGVTVRDDDVDQLVDQLGKSPVRVFIWDNIWSAELPWGLEARLQRGWSRNRLGDLVFYVRKPADRSAPVEETLIPSL